MDFSFPAEVEAFREEFRPYLDSAVTPALLAELQRGRRGGGRRPRRLRLAGRAHRPRRAEAPRHLGVGIEYPLHLFTQQLPGFAVRAGTMNEMVSRTVDALGIRTVAAGK